MASRRKDTDLSALAARAERAKADGDPGGFISGMFAASEFAIVLGGCVEFSADVPEFERKRIVMRVAHDSEITRPITAESLLKQCSKLEQAYLRLPPKLFRLLTEISIGPTIDIPRARIGTTTVTFDPKTVKGFAERYRLFLESRATLGFELPANYKRVSVTVAARTPYEAAEKALNAVDLVRASWNLSLNRRKPWRHSGGRPSPVNDIRLSPFHTVHESTGALASPTYWYDPGFAKPAGLYADKQRFSRLQEFAKNLRAKLDHHLYRPDIESALLRYVRALDASDLNDTFLRLWSLLEYLTDSSHDPYKVATRRTAFMFEDRDRANLVLTHLTQHRNRFVHAGSESDDIESLVFLLKRYVDTLLLFHLGSSFGFKSRGETARFMDLPTNRDEIDLRIRRLRSARKFVTGGA